MGENERRGVRLPNKMLDDRYYYDLSITQLRDYKKKCVNYSVSALVFFAFAGILNNAGAKNLFVWLPYITMFLPLLFIVRSTYSIGWVPDKMTKKEYNSSHLLFLRSAIVMAGLSFAAAAANGILLIINGAVKNALYEELAFIAANLIITALSVSIAIYKQKIKPKTERST